MLASWPTSEYWGWTLLIKGVAERLWLRFRDVYLQTPGSVLDRRIVMAAVAPREYDRSRHA
jgi:hypothetical protein